MCCRTAFNTEFLPTNSWNNHGKSVTPLPGLTSEVNGKHQTLQSSCEWRDRDRNLAITSSNLSSTANYKRLRGVEGLAFCRLGKYFLLLMLSTDELWKNKWPAVLELRGLMSKQWLASLLLIRTLPSPLQPNVQNECKWWTVTYSAMTAPI